MSLLLLAYIIVAVIYTTFKLFKYKPKVFLAESTTFAVSTADPTCLSLVLRQHDHLFDSFEAFSVMSRKQDILRTMKFKRDAASVLHIAGDHCRPIVEPLIMQDEIFEVHDKDEKIDVEEKNIDHENTVDEHKIDEVKVIDTVQPKKKRYRKKIQN